MKVNAVGDVNKYLKNNLPTLEEKVDAIIEGGQKLADLKQRIHTVKARVNKNN